MIDQETSINRCFQGLTDPRVQGRTRHYLSEILTIILCSMIGGAQGFNDIALFASGRRERGIAPVLPHHRTYGSVYGGSCLALICFQLLFQ